MKISKVIIVLTSVCCFNVFSKPEKNTVIINNEAKSSSANQVISAPALVPSNATKLRNYREKEEIKTEDSILQELEKQRLLDEQKRVGNMLGKNQPAPVLTNPPVSSKLALEDWFFGQKSFLGFGLGFVNYYDVHNINSTEQPAVIGSFGAYGYKGHLIFEMSAYYSKHYIKTPIVDHPNYREMVEQPAITMAIKFSPLEGRVKPYAGLSSSLVVRRWDVVTKDGTDLGDLVDPVLEDLRKDIAKKEWYLSFDAGLALGADVVLGDHLGLNIDLRYHLNLHTENRKTVYQVLTNTEILDERDSLIVSANLRYYFQ